MLSLHELIPRFGWPSDTCFIPFGSRVYGTALPDSDTDYLVLLPSHGSLGGQELRFENLNLQTDTTQALQTALDAQEISALEAYFVPGSCVPNYCTFLRNTPALRHSLSQKSSHSFVKAKKKILVEQDYRTGWKSLFHSLRILVFGIELAQTGALTNFSAANAYWDELWAAQETNWSVLQARWQPVHNALATEFRRLAPKE